MVAGIAVRATHCNMTQLESTVHTLYLFGFIICQYINVRNKTKGQLRIDNPETQATLSTRHRKKKSKTKNTQN